MTGAYVRSEDGRQSFVAAEENGTIRLEKLQLVFPGAMALTYEINGKTESVLMKEKALLSPKDGWGCRVYSVSSEAPGQIAAGGGVEKRRDGWAGQFPVHLNKKDVETAFAAEISRRGHGAPENVRVIKNRRGDGWFCYFKSDNLEKLLGTYDMYVGSTICPNLTVDYKKEERSEFIKKRPLNNSGSTNSEEKRMRVTLDNTEAENRSMRERLQKVRTSPQLAILHNRLASQEEQFAEREKQLLARIAALEADKRKKVKEAAAMRSLLEQAGLGSGEELDLLVEGVVRSLEQEVEGEENDAEVKEKEVLENKSKEGEAAVACVAALMNVTAVVKKMMKKKQD